ncbi:MAG: hypothetical protein EXS46_00885 [Candidatus Taylorbacteria bacterium]|nr:hypothetical protein [Candidatus Taylorbacteria bacterium]
MKTALVLGSGGMCGSYDAGVMTELGRTIGPRSFNAVFGASSGAIVGMYFAAGSVDAMERVWRKHVDGRKMVNVYNPFFFRNILDLESLVSLFKRPKTRLSVEALFKNGAVPVYYAVTRLPSGECEHYQVNSKDIFEAIRATAAIPLAHRRVKLHDSYYVDGGLSDPLPVRAARKAGFERVVVVLNDLESGLVGKKWNQLRRLFPHPLMHLVETYADRRHQLVKEIEHDKDVFIIRPSSCLPLINHLDTDKKRINECVDMGIKDAQNYLPKLKAFLAEGMFGDR